MIFVTNAPNFKDTTSERMTGMDNQRDKRLEATKKDYETVKRFVNASQGDLSLGELQLIIDAEYKLKFEHPAFLLEEIERLESIQKLWQELNPTVYAMYGMIANLEGEVSQLREERDMWRADSLRKYPTPDAYEAACAALEKHRKRADKAEEERETLKVDVKRLQCALEDIHADSTDAESVYVASRSLGIGE
jgi:hypothetical protein